MEKKIIGTKMLSKKRSTWKMVNRTLKACSTDQTRYFITLGFWDHKKKTLVATDGRRLHILSDGSLNDLFSDIETNCFVELNGEIVLLYDESFGKYPNWERVIPQNENLECVKSAKLSYNEICFPFTIPDKKSTFEAYVGYLYQILDVNINLGYLQDLKGAAYNVYRPTLDSNGFRNKSACKLVEEYDGHNFTVVIMPMDSVVSVEIA